MPVILAGGFGAHGGIVSALAGAAIVEILALALAWALIRLGWMAYKVWMDKQHELEMPRMLQRMEASGVHEVSRQPNHRFTARDSAVEQLIENDEPGLARELCLSRLNDPQLPVNEAEMYQAYIRHIADHLTF